jgi:cytochrome c oxidase assembly factor CtaG
MTAREMLLSWSWEPLTLFTLGLVTFFYTRGLLRTRAAKVQVMVWWRPVLFYLGMAVILLSLISPLDALGGRLFLFHMTQHMLLTFVGVPLVLLGAPVLPVLRGMPFGVRQNTIGLLSRTRPTRRLVHLLTHPLVAWSAFVVTFWVWHLPGLYSLAVTNDLAHILQHTTFLATAFLFWWDLIDPVPMAGKLPYIGRFIYLILALTQSMPLAAFLTFASHPWYEPYIYGPGLWGLTPLVDQQIGGLIMWIGGTTVYFMALGVLFAVAVRKDEMETRLAEARARAAGANA